MKARRTPGLSRHLCALFLAVSSTVPAWRAFADCVPAPSGIVSWWQSEGNAFELLNGHHGYLINNAGYATGRKGSAFNFDGDDDLVIVSNSPSLQLQELTIEAWIKRASPTVASFGSGNVGVIFGYGTGGYILYMDGSGSLYFGRLGDPFPAISTITVSDTNYHHIAVTRSGFEITFYIDGIAEVAAPYDPIFEFTMDAAIGARIENQDNSFWGRIDELSIYNRPLSGAEIQTIHLANGDGKCEPAIPPQIISNPVDATVETGASTTFAVQVVGALPLAYQWLFNGTNLPGATNANLPLHNVSPALGGEYAVLVTNVYGSAISSAAFLSVTPAPPCASWPSGLVSWWHGESNAFDHFGLNNGNLTGNATYAFGRVGTGISTDGDGDMVLLPNQPSLQLQNLTIEAWIRRGSSTVASFGAGGNGVLFGYGNGGYLSYMNSGGRMFFSKLGDNAVQSTWQIADTNLHHVAITKSNSTVTFYLDGTNVSATSYGQSFVFSSPVGIGGRPDNLDNSFLGIIDELAIYNRALSATEIESIQKAGASGKCYVPLPPTVVLQPTNRTAKAGELVNFSSSLSGTPPFALRWLRNGTPLAGATNTSLALSNVQPSQAGSYYLAVSNQFGAIQSSNAMLKVIVVSAFGNGQPLTNATHAFSGNVTIQLQNAYAGGLIFYSLDGSQPTFASTQYTSPFVVSNSVVLRALGYRVDFFESGELDPTSILLPPTYSLTVKSGGGGTVTANPLSGSYLSNTVVSLTAMPNPGWQFLQWLDDLGGANPSTNLTMNRPKSVRAVFGTTLSTTAAGGGTTAVNPTGAVYPYGTIVQISAIPNAGNQFALWGNAASGNVNPLVFVVTNANPTVSSLFAPVSAGQAALTVVPLGLGQVDVSPRANAFATGSGVNITATPSPGQVFLGWSGDASGPQNPLFVTINQSKLINANFTAKSKLNGERVAEGFRITLTGNVAAYQFESSTNLASWSPLADMTNAIGTIQFTDTAITNAPYRFYRALRLP